MRPLSSFAPEEHGELLDRKMEELSADLCENGGEPLGYSVYVPFADKRALVAFAVADGVTAEDGGNVESGILRDAANVLLEYAEEVEARGSR